jgi:hypothetical protein
VEPKGEFHSKSARVELPLCQLSEQLNMPDWSSAKILQLSIVGLGTPREWDGHGLGNPRTTFHVRRTLRTEPKRVPTEQTDRKRKARTRKGKSGNTLRRR